MKKKIAPIFNWVVAGDVLLYVVFSILKVVMQEYTVMYLFTDISMIALYLLAPLALAWCFFNWDKVKEFLRKKVVSLKRNPSIIPLLMLLVAFFVYTLNLTDVSNTTAKIQGKGMGLAQFCMMLFNLLSLVCLLNAFPRRKKANIPMVVLMFVMFGIIIYSDIHYCNIIMAALTRAESPIVISNSTIYIAEAYNMLNVYMVLICVTAGLVVLLPVYSKLLRKINTSVEVEDNGAMDEIEIAE